jgi:hypothetical protein
MTSPASRCSIVRTQHDGTIKVCTRVAVTILELPINYGTRAVCRICANQLDPEVERTRQKRKIERQRERRAEKREAIRQARETQLKAIRQILLENGCSPAMSELLALCSIPN